MPNESLRTRLQYCLPQHVLSRLVGIIMRCRKPWVKDRLIAWFIRHYAVDMSTAIQPDPHTHPDFNSFFTRYLRPELRPIIQAENAIACPVDGIVSQLGNIQKGRIFQAKGFTCDVYELLGGSSERAQPFWEGDFITLYLAPKDYHRVHMPITGQLCEMVYVPGRLFSVNPPSTRYIPNLFARNERVVSIFDTAIGPVGIVLVGAMLVASIGTVWSGIVTPPAGSDLHTSCYDKTMVKLNRGEEMGYFQLGSTVIVLFGRERVRWRGDLQPGHSVQFGELLGELEC